MLLLRRWLNIWLMSVNFMDYWSMSSTHFVVSIINHWHSIVSTYLIRRNTIIVVFHWLSHTKFRILYRVLSKLLGRRVVHRRCLVLLRVLLARIVRLDLNWFHFLCIHVALWLFRNSKLHVMVNLRPPLDSFGNTCSWASNHWSKDTEREDSRRYLARNNRAVKFDVNFYKISTLH